MIHLFHEAREDGTFSENIILADEALRISHYKYFQ